MAQQQQNVTLNKLNDLLAQVRALDISSLSPSERAEAQKSLSDALADAETPYEHLLRLSGSVSIPPFRTVL